MSKTRFLFLNVGHLLDHMFILLFPAVAALAAAEFGTEYAVLLALTTGSFVAWGSCSLPVAGSATSGAGTRCWRSSSLASVGRRFSSGSPRDTGRSGYR